MLLIAALLPAAPSMAYCLLTDPNFQPREVHFNLGSVIVPANTPVGGVFKEVIGTVNPVQNIAYCDAGGGYSAGRILNTSEIPGMRYVHYSGVKGVGLRLSRDYGSSGGRWYYPYGLTHDRQARVHLAASTLRLELIKTETSTGSGSLLGGGRVQISTYWVQTSSQVVLTSTLEGSISVPLVPTCEVDAGSRNIVVDFGDLPVSSFGGKGWRGPNRDFKLVLNCKGSDVDSYQKRVSIKLEGTQDASNLPGVLKIDGGDGAASRIGIELINMRSGKEAELRLGQGIEIGTTVKGDSVMNLPLRARYVQTEEKRVGAGKVNAKATFTIEYR